MNSSSRIPASSVVAVASSAFVLTDIAHEGFGHGAAYVLLGGRSFFLTTTRMVGYGPGTDPNGMFAGQLHADLFGRIFSLGGPLGSFLLAALCLLLLRRRGPSASSLTKLFLWLSAAFSLFWACGYMAYSALLSTGDYFELIRGARYEFFLRVVLVVLGITLYLQALSLMRRHLPLLGMAESQALGRVLAFAYLTAAVTAILGAAFDPRGPIRILHDAVPETLLANAGLIPFIIVSGRKRRDTELTPNLMRPSLFWILTAFASVAFYVAVLGPGLRLHL